MNFLSCGSDELFVGRAGYILGALWLRKTLGQPSAVPDKDLMRVCSTIVESGRAYAKQHKSPSPLMFSYYGTEYLGINLGKNIIFQRESIYYPS